MQSVIAKAQIILGAMVVIGASFIPRAPARSFRSSITIAMRRAKLKPSGNCRTNRTLSVLENVAWYSSHFWKLGLSSQKISGSHWQTLVSHSCGCSNTAQKDDSNDSYAIPHYKVDMFIQSRRYLDFWRLKTVRRFFNNKVPLYFAILRGHNIPECVLVKLAVW